MKRLSIDPITRIEGPGRVDIFLDESGKVAEAYFIVPELRAFEQLCVGRPVEEMPSLTSRICGLCPEAHQMAAAKALDHIFAVQPPPAVRAIRELLYCAFVASNHATHFFALAGPDFLLDEDVAASERTLFGVLRRLGPEMAQRVLDHRVRNHRVIEMLGGRRIHPVAVLPGGWSRPVTEETREEIRGVARDNVQFAADCLRLYEEMVLENPVHRQLLADETFIQRTYSMGTVDEQGRLQLMDGLLGVMDPDGSEITKFPASAYAAHISERVEPWTFVKLPHLKSPGWVGLQDGGSSGVYTVGPLARLNIAKSIATPRAQAAYERLYDTLGERTEDGRRRPIHNRLAIHWARLVEQQYVAERMEELASAHELTDTETTVRVPPVPVVGEAVGCVEAPRGTLIHHYRTDSRGIVTSVNLIVATTANHAAIALSVTAAARALITGGAIIDDGLVNRIEMAIRTHDPCLSCATHTQGGGTSLEIVVRGRGGTPLTIMQR